MKKKKELNHMQGKRLSECLEEKNITQKELAKKSDYSAQQINYIINGKRSMSLESARAFAKILDVDAEYLLCETKYKTIWDEINKESEEEKKISSLLHEGALSLLKANGISIEFFTRRYYNKEHDVFASDDDVCEEEEYNDEADKMLKEDVARREKMEGIYYCRYNKRFARVQFKEEPPKVFEAEEIDRFIQDIVDFAEFQAGRIRNKLRQNEEEQDDLNLAEAIIRGHLGLEPSED